MYALVLRLELRDALSADARAVCAALASATVTAPGLVSVTWLSAAAAQALALVATFDTRAACERFEHGAALTTLRADTRIADIASVPYPILTPLRPAASA